MVWHKYGRSAAPPSKLTGGHLGAVSTDAQGVKNLDPDPDPLPPLLPVGIHAIRFPAPQGGRYSEKQTEKTKKNTQQLRQLCQRVSNRGSTKMNFFFKPHRGSNLSRQQVWTGGLKFGRKIWFTQGVTFCLSAGFSRGGLLL